MKRSRFTETQIISILKEAKIGSKTSVAAVCTTWSRMVGTAMLRLLRSLDKPGPVPRDRLLSYSYNQTKTYFEL